MAMASMIRSMIVPWLQVQVPTTATDVRIEMGTGPATETTHG